MLLLSQVELSYFPDIITFKKKVGTLYVQHLQYYADSYETKRMVLSVDVNASFYIILRLIFVTFSRM